MQYMLLIYDDESRWASLAPSERAASIAQKRAVAGELRRQGRLLAADGLEPSTTATTVRRGTDGLTLTDGPFAETKEQLGGFYVVEAADLDEAIADAAAIIGHGGESIEVRPILDTSGP